MLVRWVKLRDFRTYERARVDLPPGLSVVHGPNGAGKTNLLEGIYFGCTARSMRTTNERELIRFGSQAARVEIGTADEQGEHCLSVAYGIDPAEGKPVRRIQVDGASVDRLTDRAPRPLVGAFFPDRLELVKGSPSLRRAHIDQLVAALWPARAPTRPAYSHALLQRNALLANIRAGRSSSATLASWNIEIARLAVELRDQRAAAISLLVEPFRERSRELGLAGVASLEYRPRSQADGVEEFVRELEQRTDRDIERGFSMHGPHRDEIALMRDGREVRTFGSQGEQRVILLALLLAERTALSEVCEHVPLMLLDDVMSELDLQRRSFLVDVLSDAGQSVITATSTGHVPLGAGGDRLEVSPEEIVVDQFATASLVAVSGS